MASRSGGTSHDTSRSTPWPEAAADRGEPLGNTPRSDETRSSFDFGKVLSRQAVEPLRNQLRPRSKLTARAVPPALGAPAPDCRTVPGCRPATNMAVTRSICRVGGWVCTACTPKDQKTPTLDDMEQSGRVRQKEPDQALGRDSFQRSPHAVSSHRSAFMTLRGPASRGPRRAPVADGPLRPRPSRGGVGGGAAEHRRRRAAWSDRALRVLGPVSVPRAKRPGRLRAHRRGSKSWPDLRLGRWHLASAPLLAASNTASTDELSSRTRSARPAP